jgi:uncharacterized membrane protein
MASLTRARRRGRFAVAALAVAASLAGAGAIPAAPAGAAPRSDAGNRPPVAGFVWRDGRFTTFDARGAELETVAAGINDRGRIAGTSVDGHRRAHAFVRTHRTLRTLGTRSGPHRPRDRRFDVPGASTTDASAFLNYPGTGAFDINDRDEIVGTYTGPGGTARGFVRDARGHITTFAVPGAVETFAAGLDNRGQVVGTYLGTDGLPHSFLRDVHGRVTTVDPPEGALAIAVFDIDDRGRMVGTYYRSPQAARGFVRDARGNVTTFDAPGSAGVTAATGINGDGEVVGQYQDGDGASHGFLRTGRGRFRTVDVPGNNGFSVPFHLNDRREIVGAYLRPGAADPSTPPAPDMLTMTP